MDMKSTSQSIAAIAKAFEPFVLHVEDSSGIRSAILIDTYVVTAAHGLDTSEAVLVTNGDGENLSVS
ncbi:MAG: hypothetical protein HN368_22575, partial [Spirochaetales bacterium]|nr:hypothetical protein [Spirochaetales bacterium]